MLIKLAFFIYRYVYTSLSLYCNDLCRIIYKNKKKNVLKIFYLLYIYN